jgi:hypothetical protein
MPFHSVRASTGHLAAAGPVKAVKLRKKLPLLADLHRGFFKPSADKIVSLSLNRKQQKILLTEYI